MASQIFAALLGRLIRLRFSHIIPVYVDNSDYDFLVGVVVERVLIIFKACDE